MRAAIRLADGARRSVPVMLLVGTLFAGTAVWLTPSAKAGHWIWKGWERMFGPPSLSNARPHIFAQVGGSEAYTISAINEPSAGTSAAEGTMILGVNASGAMTGGYSDQVGIAHGLVYADGAFKSFDAPNAGSSPRSGWFQGTIGMAIDTAGDAVGAYADSNSAYHGFVRAVSTGTITQFDDPNEPSPATSRGTFPKGINDSGQIVGFYVTGSYDTNSTYYGFLLAAGNLAPANFTAGNFTTIIDPNAGSGESANGDKQGTIPMAINASGMITGWYIDSSNNRHGFIYNSATNTFTVSTFDPPGSTTITGNDLSGTFATSIDAAGDVVGTYTDSNGLRHGFIRSASGTITTFDAPGATTTSQSGLIGGTFPTQIDSTGSFIVGGYSDSSGLGHSFVYYLPLTGSGSFTTFTPPDETTSTTLPIQGGALCVNASGTVVGLYLDSNEVAHGFEYTPTATPTPTLSPNQGTYSSEQSVTISDADSAAVIYYTTDGSTPTVSSTIYTEPITVSSNETINAIALDSGSGYIESEVATATYTITQPAPVPTFSPAAGTYTSSQTVTISDSTSGATIYYTTNGATPTTSSTVYSGPITVSSSETIEAIAVASGYSNSTVASATYTISSPSFTLAASPASVTIVQGNSATSTITVTDAGGFSGTVTLAASGLPSGVTASFAVGSAAGTQVVTFSAVTSAAVTSSPATVTISGTSSSLSATTTLALTVAEPPFTAGPGGTTTLSSTPGATSGNTGTISVVGTDGFSGTVTLTCSVTTTMSGVTDMPTCSLSPTSVTISGTTAQTSTLTVTTTAASSAANHIFWPSASGTSLAVLLFFMAPKRRRRWLALSALIALVLPLSLTGCGGGSGGGGGGSSNPGTTAGAYTITVTGASGSVSATVGSIALTVQ